MFVLFLIYLFLVDSVAVDFVVVAAVVRPTQYDTERYASSVANVIMHLFDNWPTQWYRVLCLPSAPSTSIVNQKMMSLPKCHPIENIFELLTKIPSQLSMRDREIYHFNIYVNNVRVQSTSHVYRNVGNISTILIAFQWHQMSRYVLLLRYAEFYTYYIVWLRNEVFPLAYVGVAIHNYCICVNQMNATIFVNNLPCKFNKWKWNNYGCAFTWSYWLLQLSSFVTVWVNHSIQTMLFLRSMLQQHLDHKISGFPMDDNHFLVCLFVESKFQLHLPVHQSIQRRVAKFWMLLLLLVVYFYRDALKRQSSYNASEFVLASNPIEHQVCYTKMKMVNSPNSERK